MNPNLDTQNENTEQQVPLEISEQVVTQPVENANQANQSNLYSETTQDSTDSYSQPMTEPAALDPDIFRRSQFKTLLKHDRIIFGGLILLLIHGFITLLATSTTSYDTAVTLRGISGLLLAATPLVMGAGLVEMILKHQQLGIKLNVYTRYSIGLVVLGIILAFAPTPMNIAAPIIWLISLGCLLYGQITPVGSNQRTRLEGFAKYALLVVGFLVAGIFGLIVSFIMYLIIDLKVCELSSSKCY